MIIQCEKCQTKFRLDDSRVTDRGAKVRCAKCKHVFRVQRDGQIAESFDSNPVSADFSLPAINTEAANSVGNGITAEAAPENPFDSMAFEDTSGSSEPTDFASFEASSFDNSAISFETESTASSIKPAEVSEAADSTHAEVDFSGFDFGDSDAEPDPAPAPSMPVTPPPAAKASVTPAAPQKAAPQGLDFSDDDMFGAVVPSAPEAPGQTISFDLDDDSFAESMDMSSLDSGSKRGGVISLDSQSDAPFSLGEIDFGDELTSVAVQQVNPDDLKPSQKILFAPLAEAQEKTADDELKRSFLGDASQESQQQELPPLSIASRRKQSPLFNSLIAVVSVLVVAVLGYMVYSSFSATKETAVAEAGKIGIRAVKAAYVANSSAGELLVISGEALNEYPKPRAALQVKVTVSDAAGQAVTTKSAYGGNPLTDEQLRTLPMDKIEAAMTNQFGDSLANMEVAPGKAIPFVVVLSNLPKGSKDFSVQSAGSTVATGKQQ